MVQMARIISWKMAKIHFKKKIHNSKQKIWSENSMGSDLLNSMYKSEVTHEYWQANTWYRVVVQRHLKRENPNRWWNIITPLKCGSNRRNTLSDSWKEQCSARQNFLRYIYVGNCLASIPPIHPAHILSKKLTKGPIFKVGPNTY